MPTRGTGPAVFCVSAAVLAAQVLLLRLFATESFHHFAYMAIGVALLGFGASGAVLVVLEERIGPRLGLWFQALALAFPLTLVAGIAVVNRIPFEPTQLLWDRSQWLWLALTYGSLAGPFLVAAAVIGIALMAAEERVGRVYAWNLVGSGLGSGAALLLLMAAPPDRALAGAVAMAAAGAVVAVLSPSMSRGRLALAALPLAAAVWCGLAPPWEARPSPFKGLPQVEAFPDARRSGEAWSPTGWAVAVEASAFRHAPGLSLSYTGSLPRQTALFVDGEAAGAATHWQGLTEALSFTDWLPSAVAFRVARPGRVLVLGSGGGLEILSALAHGAESATGVELVAPLVALTDSAVDPASRVAGRGDVRIVIGDARAFVARTEERFDVVVLPLSGAMATAAAGIYSLGEDYLNTVEAYRACLRVLAPGGVVAVTRWTRTPPRDNVRVLLTAAAALRAEGVEDVGGTLAFLRSWATGTVLVRPAGFRPAHLERLRAFAAERRFDLDWPEIGTPSFNLVEPPTFAQAARAAAGEAEQAAAFADGFRFRVEPTTDDRPYFGRFLRVGAWPDLLGRQRGTWLPFAEWGSLAVAATLIQSALLALALIGLPGLVLVKRREARFVGRSALYFGALGFGYVFIEMTGIQRLSLLLGHPVYAAAATLAALLAFSGLGSAFSDRLAGAWTPRACLGVALLAGLAAVAAPWAGAITALPVGARIAIALGVIAIPAVVMGVPFPSGLRLFRGNGGGVAWAWAANGVTSVMGASAAILIAMELGGRGLLLVGAACYLVAAAVAHTAVSRAE
jgi:spermidine synthase